MISLNTLIFKIQKYIILFIPLALITGPFVPDAIVSLSAALLIISVIIEKKYFFFLNKFFLFFIIYCLYLVSLSLFVAENLYLSLESSLFYFRFGLFVLSVVYVLEKDNSFEKLFLKVFFITLLLLLSDALLQFFIGINSVGLIINIFDNQSELSNRLGYTYTGIFPDNRFSSFFGKEKVLGSYISRFFPFLLLFIYKFSYKKNTFVNLFSFIAFVSSFVVVYLSG